MYPKFGYQPYTDEGWQNSFSSLQPIPFRYVDIPDDVAFEVLREFFVSAERTD